MHKKIRPMGQITSSLEKLLEELVDSHDLQKGEILALISVWCDIHRPGCKEVYLDGANPEFRYGPKK